MRILIILVLSLFTLSSFGQQLEDTLVKELFTRYNVNGSITLYDSKTAKWYFTDSTDSKLPSLPASTFKIINTLIAFQEGVISSVDDTFRFDNREIDTLKYGYRPSTYKDATISTAFKKSIVWVYRDIAQQIDDSMYLEYLNEINYGDNEINSESIDFWNYGDFGVTPVQQINMLIKLYDRELPFDKKFQSSVINIMYDGKFEGHKVFGKTGWTRYESEHIGWWVGFIDVGHGSIYFATRVRRPIASGSNGFSESRKMITLELIKHLLGGY